MFRTVCKLCSQIVIVVNMHAANECIHKQYMLAQPTNELVHFPLLLGTLRPLTDQSLSN